MRDNDNTSELIGTLDYYYYKDIVDNLESYDTDKALSANQGRILGNSLKNNYYDEITVEKSRYYDTDCYITTIPLNDSDNNQIDVFVGYGNGKTPTEYARDENTTLTINASLNIARVEFDMVGRIPSIISNGEIIRTYDDNTNLPDCYEYIGFKADRSIKTYKVNDTTAQDMIDDGVINAFDCFYPLIVDGVNVDLTTIHPTTGDNVTTDVHPRQCIGIKNDKTLIILTCEGRSSENIGLTSAETQTILGDLGCANAWNLDGGGSTSTTIKGVKINQNYDNDGTTDRIIPYTLNVKKTISNQNIADIYSFIGENNQNLYDLFMPIYKKYSIFKVTPDMSHQQIQTIFDFSGYKIVEFKKGNYTFDEQFKLNANTKIILNNSTLTFTQRFAFWNFKPTDRFLEYNGNGNIEIIGGTIIGGSIRFCHAKNIIFKNLNFIKCLANHVLEMASINGLVVSNCYFDGQTDTNNDSFRETIQIDDMTRDNFPWFDDADNPTYDNTPNTNWEISHCKFFNSNSNNYAFHTAIGNHTYVEGYIHTNIYIHHNEFDGFDFAGIRLKNNKNTTIENNVFKCGISDTYEVTVVYVENVSENLKISNNTVDGNVDGTSRLLAVGTNAINLEVINNVVKNFKTQSEFSQSTTNIIMRIWDSDVKIKNNLFENFDKNLLYILDETHDSNLIFEGNIVRNTTTDTNLMRCYSKCDIVCNNNTFDVENVAYVLRISSNVKSISFKNNSLNNYLKTKAIDLGTYTGSLANVYDVMFSGWVENVSSLTSRALNKPYSDFDTAFLDCGVNGENLTQFRLQKYGRDGKLNKATYKLLATDKNDNIKVITFSFNEDGTISYSSTDSGINFRSIKFTNSSCL